MKRIHCVLLIVLLNGWVACGFGSDYVLGPQDVLKIIVYREKDLDRDVKISSEGYISFPLLGMVRVQGMTVSEMELYLQVLLKKYLKNPQVTVQVREYAAITINGQVEKPGKYALKGNLSVIDALSMAGGFTKIASKNRVRVLRQTKDGHRIITVRVADMSKTGDMSGNVVLQRGDIVIVPESLF